MKKASFDICVFTNGRSSFDYCMKSIESQTIKANIHLYENLQVANSMNQIIKDDNVSEYFVKIDDDFILHPYAFEYMEKFIPFNDNVGFKYWHLFDAATSSNIQSIKMYSKTKALEVGGFIPDESGRIDVNFMHKIKDNGNKILKDDSVIAVHCCPPMHDQNKYEKIWKRASPTRMHTKPNKHYMRKYKKELIEQYEESEKWINKSNKNTLFSLFLRDLL